MIREKSDEIKEIIDIYLEGKEAAKEDKSIEENPYTDKHLRLWWDFGYNDVED